MKVLYENLPEVEIGGRKLVGRVLFGLLILIAILVGATGVERDAGRHGAAMALAKVVVNNRRVAECEQPFDDNASDISSASGYENCVGAQSPQETARPSSQGRTQPR